MRWGSMPLEEAMMKGRGPGRRGREAGFSLVELVIALAVMAIAIMALMVSVTSSSKLSDTNHERTIAYELAKSKIEEIRNFTRCGSFDKIFWYYAVKPEVNTIGAGGKTITAAVAGANGKIYAFDPTLYDPTRDRINSPQNGADNPTQLNPVKLNGVDQPILTVQFPVDATGALTENPPAGSVWTTRFGMPKDLNRNGTPPLPVTLPFDSGAVLYEVNGGTPPATAYTILPVLVTVQWQSAGTKGTAGAGAYVEIATFITAK
jgi:prepilin-type N-terminal cleavage/methylation domain-containing protein